MSKHYVDLNQIIDHLEDEWGYEGMREELYEIPPADVVEVKHGKWIEYNSEFYCSNCNRYQSVFAYKSNFCPWCGADMRGEVE